MTRRGFDAHDLLPMVSPDVLLLFRFSSLISFDQKVNEWSFMTSTEMSRSYDPEYVKILFDNMSQSYERVNYIASFGFCIRWRKQFIRRLPKSTHSLNVIDLMTGRGETWEELVKHYPNANLSALDFSSRMLKYANLKNSLQFENKINTLNQNVLQNSLQDNQFDIAISAFGLKTFDENQIHRLADELQRILKPGGKFAFIELSEPSHKLLRVPYKIYLRYFVPLLGRLLLANPEEYQMLWKYTESFKNVDKTLLIFEKTGLTVTRQSYLGDCASGISGMKKKIA